MLRQLFIFDYDGTICDTRGAISASLRATFSQYSSHTPSDDAIMRLIASGKTLQETMQELHSSEDGFLDGLALRNWVYFYREHYSVHSIDSVKLFDGAHDTLEHLASIGDSLLVSNKGIAAVEESLRHFRLIKFFSAVLAEEAGQPGKPDGAVFAQRIPPLFPGITPRDCIVIGDTSADLTFARNIGAVACFAAYGFGDLAQCEEIGFDYRLSA